VRMPLVSIVERLIANCESLEDHEQAWRLCDRVK
jgi:hypothetical protein